MGAVVLPELVNKTLAVMKGQSRHYVFVNVLRGKYRVYEGTSHFDKEKNRPKMTAKYLGTITPDGMFIPAQHMQYKARVALTPDQIRLEGDEIRREASLELKENERKLLTILSMNGRATPKLIGRMLGTSPESAQYLVKKLEVRFGIKYFADIAFWKFGLNQFVGFIKFNEVIPPAEEIRQSLGGDPHVQMVALTSGDYDVFFYFLAESNDDAVDIAYKLQTETKLADYNAEWNISYFYQAYGAIPIRPEFFELLEGKVWHRTKETPTKKKEELWKREYTVLRELCRDGATSFAEIDRRNKLEDGSAQYTFSKLKESGIIRRITCSMQNLPLKYNVLLFADYVAGRQFAASQNALLSDIIESTEHPVNKYALAGDVNAPRSGLMIAPIFKDNETAALLELGRSVNGVKVRMLIITSILVGSLCYRLFDNEHSSQWEYLEQKKAIAPKAKTDYEETGRVRKKHIHVEEEQGIYGIRYE
jgi:DNA-binding Lrp family transcriptional regulator